MLGEDGPRADVGLGERVLDGSEEETAAAHHGTVVETRVDRILGLVVVVVPGRRHFAGWWWEQLAGGGEMTGSRWRFEVTWGHLN